MDFYHEYRVAPGQNVRLDQIETRVRGPFESKSAGKAFVADAIRQIQDLQYRLYVERKQSLLIVLQGLDAGGKDGVIRKVLGQMNPQGCRTFPFKVPSEIERAHDFLWRIHRCTPPAGHVSVFNRSHYEDILAVRVQQLAPKAVWSKRYEQINHFEELLAESNTTVIKFYLHISPEEQLERFKERLDRPEKHWKLNAGDYATRQLWPQYRQAYQDVFARCSVKRAPWFVIPADRKWYRNAAVAAIVLHTLRKMDPQLPPVVADLDEIRALYQQAAEQ